MSKASEWAAKVRDERPAKWDPGIALQTSWPQAFVTMEGGAEYVVIEGVGTAKLHGPVAVKLAHWILDTFGEAS